MFKEKNTIQFISCPTCSGSGTKNMDLACSACAGMGLGAFFHGRFFYWQAAFTRAAIQLNRFKRILHLILNLAAFIIVLSGLLGLGIWIWSTTGQSVKLSAFAFWRAKDFLILFFWISVIAQMFVVYRLSREEDARHKIKKPSYNEKQKIKIQGALPNNWDELKKFKNKVDVLEGFGSAGFRVLENAFKIAEKEKQNQAEPIHLFLALLNDEKVKALFSRLNVPVSDIAAKINNRLDAVSETREMLQLNQRKNTQSPRIRLSQDAKKIFIKAYLAVLVSNQEKIEPMHFILPALSYDQSLAEILYDFDIDRDKIVNSIEWFSINEQMVKNYRIYKKMARFKPASKMDRAYTAMATPVLDNFSYDLTRSAKWGRLEMCVARDEEIENIFSELESGQAGVILIGQYGVGKRTVVEGIAQLMVREDVPKILKDKRLVELDAARLVSGASPAEAQERLLVMIDEVGRAGNIILFIDNIENIVGITAGEEESLELSEVLVSALERKALLCLASATSQNYTKYIESKPLGRQMAKQEIKEPKGNQAIQIMESKIGYLEGKYKVYFSYDAIEQAVKESDKYIHDQYLPEKAIKILESVAVRVAKAKPQGSLVTEDDVALSISEITRIPITKIAEDESQKLLNLEERIHKRMVDQEEAVNMVAASLRRARTELREGKRPIANFLFLGPTGVGKTELAKTVSEIYFGSEKYMIRLDMSEYQHPDSIKKMIGDASGVQGYLTEAARKNPFSLILLDELEKAYADILNLFLQVMDDGRLTDGQGRTIDFTNSIIIATSNAGSVYIQNSVSSGIGIDEIKKALINEHLNKVMRPELINRFDGVVVFKPLSQEDVFKIANLILNKTRKMLEEKGIGLRAEEEGARELARLGFDPKFGARPLRRLLRERVNDVVANKILSGELKRRDTVVIGENAEIRVEKGRVL